MQSRKVPNPFALAIDSFPAAIWVMRLYRFFNHYKPTIVHTASMWSHILAGMAARLAGYPVVWHFQDIVSPESGWGIYRELVILWAKYIPSRIVCVSEKVAEQFQHSNDISNKVDVLWNIVDMNRFVANTRTHTYDHISPLTIGTVARLTPWKGHEVALRSAHLLKQSLLPFRWLFAGDEALGSREYRAHLLDLVHKWDLEKNIEFVGWVEDMPSFYSSLDVLVHLPVEPDPCPLVLAEAIASGLPIVLASGGGADEMVKSSGGILVPPNNPDTVADILATFYKSPDELTRIGKLARKYAEQAFSAETYIRQLTDIYTSLQSRS
jgi:glycosyltransferase involved in cell wall biosynthesis